MCAGRGDGAGRFGVVTLAEGDALRDGGVASGRGVVTGEGFDSEAGGSGAAVSCV